MPKGVNKTNPVETTSAFVRLQLDIPRDLSDTVNEYCESKGMTKKGFFRQAAIEKLATKSTSKKKGK